MAMTRFEINLPDYTELIWASEAAQGIWKKKISAAANAWDSIELELVARRLKPCALRNVRPENISKLALWALENNLVCLPLGQVGRGENYSNSVQKIKGDWDYRVFVGTQETSHDFYHAYMDQDNRRMGNLLGYPSCCRDFFDSTWGSGMLDTTIPQAMNTIGRPITDLPEEVINFADRGIGASVLLRWIGLRLVSHLPCKFNCKESLDHAQEAILVGNKIGYIEEVSTITKLLSMSMEYSTAHGITIINTPIFKILTRGDGISGTVTIRFEGEFNPERSAQGLKFPYGRPLRPSQEIKIMSPARDTWTPNGFTSQEAMDRAHEVVIRACDRAGLKDALRVLDLGCGNGLLLSRLLKLNPKLSITGYEIKHDRIPEINPYIITGDFSKPEHSSVWAGKNWDIVIISANRFKEVKYPEALMCLIEECAKEIVIYNYDDNPPSTIVEQGRLK